MVLLFMFIGIVIFSASVVHGIDTMHEKHPDYNGDDLFGEESDKTNFNI